MGHYVKNQITIPQEAWDELLDKSSHKTGKQQAFNEGIKKILQSGYRILNEKGRTLGYNPVQDRFYDRLVSFEPDRKKYFFKINKVIDRQVWGMFLAVLIFLLIKIGCIYVLWTSDPEGYKKLIQEFPYYRPGLTL